MVKRRTFRADDWHSRENVTSRLRMRGHDYSSASSYFVTICTQGRECSFGSVVNGAMEHSIPGLMAESWWLQLPLRFPGVEIDTFVIMPNHMHGIVYVGTKPELEVNPSLDTVVGWYKSITTHDYGVGVRAHGFQPYDRRLWQKGFHERILRNYHALDAARAYIDANPANWAEDEENPDREPKSP